MSQPLTPHTALYQVLRLRADALGLTMTGLVWRIQQWGLERACTTPRQRDKGETMMARAIAAYYERHPHETPPWGREKVSHAGP